ncbi:MAG: glycosyltransferase [Calditrichota bacterium]
MSLVKPRDNSHGTQPECSIIIPVYNGFDYTRDCIETLLADSSRTPYELIIVDNDSSDGVENYLAAREGWLILLKPGRNLGFAAANNLAARRARGPFITLLNSDTLPQPGWLDHLVECAKQDKEIGVVGARLLFPLNRLVQHAGVAFTNEGSPYHIYQGFPDDHPAVSHRREFKAVTAACALIRRDLYQELGGLDEGFVNGFEDVDFCLRARERGFKVVYEPQAVALHHAEASPGRHAREYENGVRLYQKWQGRLTGDDHLYYNQDGFEIIINPFMRDNLCYVPVEKGVKVEALLSQGITAAREGRIFEAIERFERAHYAAPLNPVAARYLATTYERMGDAVGASKVWMRLSALEPGVETLLKLADNALRLRQYELARRYAQGVVDQVKPPLRLAAEGWAIMGDASFKLGDPNRAVMEYDMGIEADSSNLRALVGRGTIYLTQGDQDRALEYFSSALEGHPHQARPLLGKGLALLGCGDRHQAAAFITAALRLEPDNNHALTMALPILTESDELDTAEELLNRYLDRYPDDAAMLLANSGVCWLKGDIKRARRVLNRLLAVAPDFPGASDMDHELKRHEPVVAGRIKAACA